MGRIILWILVLVVVVIIIADIKIIPQAYAHTMEQLETYHATREADLHMKIPFIDRISKKASLKEWVIGFPSQPVITKDNITVQIDTVVHFQITNPKLYAYGVERPTSATENLSAAALRDTTGELELDTIPTSHDVINNEIRIVLDEATGVWDTKVNCVELKNILSSPVIQDSMEKQMKAECDRRAIILDAEGQKRSVILIVEGQKEAAILAADTQKQSYILEIRGEAQVIMSVQQALTDNLKLLSEVTPSDRVITFRSLEAFQKIADGRATKIIIPSEIQGLADPVTSVKELFAEDPRGEKLDHAKQVKQAAFPGESSQ